MHSSRIIIAAALSAHSTPAGMAMSIIDRRFLPETVEAAVAAGH